MENKTNNMALKARETIEKRASFIDTVIDGIEDRIVTTIEVTRASYNYSRSEFSKLFRMSYDNYVKRTRSYYKKDKDGKKYSVRTSFSSKDIIRFCYIFGYDLETFFKSNSTSFFSSEQATVELALQIAAMNDEAMEEVANTISKSKNIDRVKKIELVHSINAFIDYRHNMLSGVIEKKENSDDNLNEINDFV